MCAEGRGVLHPSSRRLSRLCCTELCRSYRGMRPGPSAGFPRRLLANPVNKLLDELYHSLYVSYSTKMVVKSLKVRSAGWRWSSSQSSGNSSINRS